MLVSRGEEIPLGMPLSYFHHAWGLEPMRRARHVSDTSRVKFVRCVIGSCCLAHPGSLISFFASSDAVVRRIYKLNVSNPTAFLLHLPMHCGLQTLVVHRNYDRQQRCLFILLSTMSVHWRTQLGASHWGLPHSVCCVIGS